MAEGDDTERSEEPSQKKLDDARQKGDVAKSQEVNTWFLLLGGALVLLMFTSSSSLGLAHGLKVFLAQPHEILTDGRSLIVLSGRVLVMALMALGLPFLMLMAAAFAGNFVQHGLLWTSEPITPKFSKISPMQGFTRIFSKQGVANFVKGIIKMIVVGVAVAMTVMPERDKLGLLATMDVAALGPYMLGLSVHMFGTVVAVMAIVAAVDWLYQYQTWYQRQRMSVQELKEEYKQQEGDPTIKARIRQLRMERSRKRMMANVPQATVVITNPTHYAVALKYQPGMNAPLCVAKGMDAVALRIRAVAEENGIPVVENPPLARALHKTVELDAEIPAEHYRAVAEVVGYVMGLKKKWSR